MCKINIDRLNSFHLIGVGGIGMSAIAKYLLKIGKRVSGSDIKASDICRELTSLGCKTYLSHDNMVDADAYIYTSAIQNGNAELSFALSSGKPVLSRAQMLSRIADRFKFKITVAGTHGKTTVTAMLAHVLRGEKKFCAFIGGKDKVFGNFYMNGDDVFLCEACEYKHNLLELQGDLSLLLNCESDHMECYGTQNELSSTFNKYLNAAKYSIISEQAAFCAPDTECATFGLSKKCRTYADNIKFVNETTEFDVYENEKFLTNISLKISGEYNVLNALAAICAARRIGVSVDKIKSSLDGFENVTGRMEKICEINGAEVYRDYAHHPTEIKNAYQAFIKLAKGKPIVVFQPHTYSRTRLLLNEFVEVLKDVDCLSIYKTFPAREKYLRDGSAKRLYEALSGRACYLSSKSAYQNFLHTICKGQSLLVLGAGTLGDVTKKLADIHNKKSAPIIT